MVMVMVMMVVMMVMMVVVGVVLSRLYFGRIFALRVIGLQLFDRICDRLQQICVRPDLLRV
jgi:cytochrome b subunit of formate dehydrogenase